MGKRKDMEGVGIHDSPGQLDSHVGAPCPCFGLKGVDFKEEPGRTQLTQQALSVLIKIQPADEHPIHGTKRV